MLEVNVVSTDTAQDLVFPKKETRKGKWKEAPDSEIRLSSQAIKDLGVDGMQVCDVINEGYCTSVIGYKLFLYSALLSLPSYTLVY